MHTLRCGCLQFRYVESEDLVESRKVVGVCWGQVGHAISRHLALLTVSGFYLYGLSIIPS